MTNPHLATGNVWPPRSALAMTFPDGSPVAEINVHRDGTAGWRCHDELFDTAGALGKAR